MQTGFRLPWHRNRRGVPLRPDIMDLWDEVRDTWPDRLCTLHGKPTSFPLCQYTWYSVPKTTLHNVTVTNSYRHLSMLWQDSESDSDFISHRCAPHVWTAVQMSPAYFCTQQLIAQQNVWNTACTSARCHFSSAPLSVSGSSSGPAEILCLWSFPALLIRL